MTPKYEYIELADEDKSAIEDFRQRMIELRASCDWRFDKRTMSWVGTPKTPPQPPERG